MSLAWLALTLLIDAPPSQDAAAARIRAADLADLGAALARAGLTVPATVRVTLVPDTDSRAGGTPPWIVGRASASGEVTIFPSRIGAYPYESLEGVLRHEIVHIALFEQSRGESLPRWFHEGVATSVEAGWGADEQIRLVFAAFGDPTIEDVHGLFRSEAHPTASLAYLLSAVLVEDLRRRHGEDLPGRIAALVGEGVEFEQAFATETGESPDTAAARAWTNYRRLSAWAPFVTGVNSLWTFILVLAFVAYFVRMRQRVRRRRQWDEEELDGSADPR